MNSEIKWFGGATRPWRSTEAEPTNGGGRFVGRYKDTDKSEIEACLHCPFASCDGIGRICKTFRLRYKATLEERKP